MTTVADHYRNLLAPVYLWMAGGFDAAIARGQSEVDAVLPGFAAGRVVVDLGAGFGMHAVPLARRGCTVLAIDSSELLLGELREHAETLPVTVVADDLLSFRQHLNGKADAILCMGDTLNHLHDTSEIERLFSEVGQSLHAGGRLILSFRDYGSALSGPERFIPVRSDADRILTCFLDHARDHVNVHDMLHERNGATWNMRVSAYRKLRLSPRWVCAALEARGFAVRAEPGLGGMIRIVASITTCPARVPVTKPRSSAHIHPTEKTP